MAGSKQEIRCVMCGAKGTLYKDDRHGLLQHGWSGSPVNKKTGETYGFTCSPQCYHASYVKYGDKWIADVIGRQIGATKTKKHRMVSSDDSQFNNGPLFNYKEDD